MPNKDRYGPNLRESMGVLIERITNIQEDMKEIKDSVMGPDGCQRNFGQRIANLEGTRKAQGNIQRFTTKQKVGGGTGAAVIIYAIFEVIHRLGWL